MLHYSSSRILLQTARLRSSAFLARNVKIARPFAMSALRLNSTLRADENQPQDTAIKSDADSFFSEAKLEEAKGFLENETEIAQKAENVRDVSTSQYLQRNRGHGRRNDRPFFPPEYREQVFNAYAEVNRLLEEGNLVKATKLFEETYRPEEAVLFASFKTPDNKKLSLHLFQKVSEAFKRSSPPEGLITPSALFKLYLQGNFILGWMCADAIMYEVSRGNQQEGLEVWVQFLEQKGDVTKAVRVENREAAIAALTAYITQCLADGSEISTEIASELIPVKSIPEQYDIQRFYRTTNFKIDADLARTVEKEIAKLRFTKLDPTNPDFLDDLPIGQVSELESRYKDVLDKAEKENITLPESVYNRFMFCFAESGRPDRALDIWSKYLAAGFVPTVHLWNTLLKAIILTKKQDVAVLEALIVKMKDSGVEPDSNTYGTLIDAYFKAKTPWTGIEIFEKIRSKAIDVPLNLYILNVTINGLLNNNMEPEAYKLLIEGIENGYIADVIAFNTFISTYIRYKKFNKIDNILKLMEQNNITPNIATYTNLIDSVYKNSSIRNVDPKPYVDALIKEMEAKGIRLNINAITAIIDGMAKSGNGHESNMAMYKLIQQKRLRPNIRTYTSLINGEFISGNTETAEYFFREIKFNGITRNTSSYNQMIRAFGERGNVDKAYQYFKELLKEKNLRPNIYTYYFMLSASAKTIDFRHAQDVLNVLSKEPSDFKVGRVLPSVLRQLRKNKKLVVPVFESENYGRRQE